LQLAFIGEKRATGERFGGYMLIRPDTRFEPLLVSLLLPAYKDAARPNKLVKVFMVS
jgi:hypothetical protein